MPKRRRHSNHLLHPEQVDAELSTSSDMTEKSSSLDEELFAVPTLHLQRSAECSLPWLNEYSSSPPPAYRHLAEHCEVSAEVAALPSYSHLFPGCSCTGGLCNANCNCRLKGTAGYQNDLLRAEYSDGLTLFECNSHCVCDAMCPNRVSQQFGSTNITVPPLLYLFRLPKVHDVDGSVVDRGWGLKCKRTLERGEMIGEYLGRLCDDETCMREDARDEYMFMAEAISVHAEDVSELQSLADEHALSLQQLLTQLPRITTDALECGNVTRCKWNESQLE
jgi:hypothetical protein